MMEEPLADDPLAGIWDTMPTSDDPADNLLWLNSLTRVQRVLYVTHYLCAEVYNGGFHQYFSNTTGVHAPEAVLGFDELDLHDIAEIVNEAITLFGDPYPREREVREKFLDAIENPFSDLDSRFYESIAIPRAPELHNEDRFTVVAREFMKHSR